MNEELEAESSPAMRSEVVLVDWMHLALVHFKLRKVPRHVGSKSVVWGALEVGACACTELVHMQLSTVCRF